MKVFLIFSFLFSSLAFAQEIPGDHIEFNLQDEQIEKVVIKKSNKKNKNKKKKDLQVFVHMNELGAKAMQELALKNPGKEVKVYSHKRFLDKFRLTPDSAKIKAFKSLESWRSESEVTKVFDTVPKIISP